MHTTYIFVVEIQSPGQGELETALVELAKRYPISWQAGPREFKVSPKVAGVQAMTKDNAPSFNAPSFNAPSLNASSLLNPHDNSQKN